MAGPRGTAQLTSARAASTPPTRFFNISRKPLAAEFRYRGKPLFIVGNHFASKGGDDPVYGRYQDRAAERAAAPRQRDHPADRARPAWSTSSCEASSPSIPRARVLVLGDLNDFEFSETVKVLQRGADEKGCELIDLWHFVPQDERYSYVFQGNGQVLDHILVSPTLLLEGRPDLDSVHINAEFEDQASDHDPPITRFDVGR